MTRPAPVSPTGGPMAGYSGTPLVRKLGIKPAARVALLNAPTGFVSLLTALPDDVTIRDRLGGGPFDVILLFTTSQRDLRRQFDAARNAMTPAAGLWVCWPKKASGVETDLTENVIRDIGLDAGVVDN